MLKSTELMIRLAIQQKCVTENFIEKVYNTLLCLRLPTVNRKSEKRISNRRKQT